MGRVSPRVPIPAEVYDALAPYSIRWVHRQLLKRALLPAEYTEFLFRKIWRMKRGSPKEIIALRSLAEQFEAEIARGENPLARS